MCFESEINTEKYWYLGNNISPNLRISSPQWDKPFFLTTSIKYAQEYADYGIWKVELKNEINSNICNFDNDNDVKQLKWPKILIDEIRSGKYDLNSIAVDLFKLANHATKLYTLKISKEWINVSNFFQDKYLDRRTILNSTSNWAMEDDYAFLLEMWKDIKDAGFDGFTHIEFGNQILALFSIKSIEKISVQKIK